MLTLHYNGYDIPTGKDFSVRLSWKNPACFTSEIPGAAGLGIDIPVNDYSKAIFGSPHRFEKYGTGSDRKFSNVDIRFNGVLLMSGTLNITNATRETYSAWLQSQVGVIGEEQREKFINEMDWSDFEQETLDNKGTFDEDSDDYCTGEHYNRRFWEEIGKLITETEDYTDEEGEDREREVEMSKLTAFHRDNFGFLVNKTNANVAIATGDGCVVSGFLFLKFLLHEVLKQCQLFIDPANDAFTDELSDYAQMALYNNYNMMAPTFGTAEITVTEYDLNTGDPYEVTYQQANTITWALAKFDYVRLIPRVNIGNFILGLQNLFNIAFHFRNDSKVNVIDREGIITGTAFDLDKYFLDEWIIGERKDLTLKFIQEYDQDDSIYDNFHDLTERRDDFGADVATKEDLEDIAAPAYGEIRHVLYTDEYYEYKWDKGVQYNELNIATEFDKVGWALISTGPQPFLFGNGDEIEEIKTVFSVPYSNQGASVVVLQKGVINTMRNLWNNFTPRLFFHYANNQITTVDAVSGKDLKWTGTNGLIQTRWKYWAAFWRNRLPVEGDFDLPLNVIYYIINNITGKYKTNHGEFVIEEMEVEFGMNMIGKTRIKGYKL